MADRVSIPRLRRVRFKDGGADLTVMRRPDADRRRAVRSKIEEVLSTHGPDVAGCALVVWGMDFSSTAGMRVTDGPLSQASVPDFVRTRLIADIAERWTIGALRDNGDI
ncbi:MAG TPA: hypothetical protein VGR45_02625 [Stellaceae bacterium]|nr:hypothetical protein [Stellaceae bacterium]